MSLVSATSANIIIPVVSVSGVASLDFSTTPQDILDSQLVGEKKVDSWAYDLDIKPITKGEAYDSDVINLSIENILSTLRGERLFNDRFGSILPMVFFEQLDYTSSYDLLESLLTSIKRFEKRITVIQDQVELNILTDQNAIILIIPYIINRTGLTNRFSKKVVL